MIRKLLKSILKKNRVKITSAAASPPFNFHYPENSEVKNQPDGFSFKSTIKTKPDLLIGAISGYDYGQIQYFVNSLDQSGFTGIKVIIVYEASFDTVNMLVAKGFQVLTFAENSSEKKFFYPLEGFRHTDTSIDRFYQIWRYLQLYSDDYRFVISMDVRDVIFQSNPSTWLEKNLGSKKINVGSECIPEEWNLEMIQESYGPLVHQMMENVTTMNAGTIAGHADAIKDLSLNVFLCSQHNNIPYTDQAALNIILSGEAYKSITKFNKFEEDWACQGGIIGLPKYKKYLESHPDSSPPFLDNEWVITPSGKRYCIVHQYDKIPEWRAVLQHKYENTTK